MAALSGERYSRLVRRVALLSALLAIGCQTKQAARSFAGPAGERSSVSQRAPVRSEPRAPQIAALDTEIYIRQAPRATSPEIGVLHFGSSIARSAEPVTQNECAGGWYRVEPEGYVCHGRTTTLEPETHPLIRAARLAPGNFASALPYRWFESAGDAPLYRKLPEKLNAHDLPEFLGSGDVSPWSLVHTPSDRRPRVRVIGARSTVAATREIRLAGESYWLTSELLLVPSARVTEQRASSFEGVHLARDRIELPIAFVRFEDKPKFRPLAADLVPASHGRTEARLAPSGESFPRLSWLRLTGRAKTERSTTFLETAGGDWIRQADATLVRAEPPRGFELEAGERWIDVSIFRGTLVAYEGSTPVFATLISPGQNGYRRIDGKPGRFTTPTGTFRLEWKHRSTDMTPDPERPGYSLAEVPYTQFFHMPFALHAAYWHDRFGEPKSGGCINLSPADAKWLFEWTTPRVPPGWHGVRSGASRGPGTWVRIR